MKKSHFVLDIDVVSTLTSVTPVAAFVPGVTNQLTFAMSLTNNNDPDSNLDVAEVEESDVENFDVTFRFVDVAVRRCRRRTPTPPL